MKNCNQFRVGDKIFRFGKIYKIFKIRRQKNFEGKTKIKIFFRPYFKSKNEEKGLTFSIPIESLDKTNIRKPVGKKQLKELLRGLADKSEVKKFINIAEARKTLLSNNLHKTAQILKTLSVEKNDKSKNFTKTQNDIYNLSIRNLSEEIGFVFDVSLAIASKKIKKALEAGQN